MSRGPGRIERAIIAYLEGEAAPLLSSWELAVHCYASTFCWARLGLRVETVPRRSRWVAHRNMTSN
jgi:hypothetical protein